MRPDRVVLTPVGLFSEEWDKEQDDYVKEKYDLSLAALLDAWTSPLRIEEGTTLHHFFTMLRRLDDATITAIESLTNSNIVPFLEETTKIFPAPPDDSGLLAVEVYKSIDIDNHETCDERMDFGSYMHAHGLGKPWDGPEMADVPLEKRGNAYAIEFTPWYELRNLPLVIRPTAYVKQAVWKKCEERPLVHGPDGEVFLTTDRDLVSIAHPEWAVSISLGEFFQGIFDELSFFGSPEVRNEQKEVLDERFEEVKNALDQDRNDDE